MPHINVKPFDRHTIFENPEQAIRHVLIHRDRYAVPTWDFGGRSFGHTIAERRKLMTALDTKDITAFKASQRRGYWRVEARMTPDAIAEAVLLLASRFQRASLTVTWPTPEQVAAAALEN